MDVDLFITDEFKEVVERVNTKLQPILNKTIKFFFGEDEHVVKEMRDMNLAGFDKYPLIALVLPVDIVRGNAGGYYGIARIPRIVIATLTDANLPPAQRQETVIKPIIQPMYKELIIQMSKQPSFVIMGDQIEHTQRIRFGTTTAAQGFREYIDGMELLDTRFSLDTDKC